MVQVLVAPNAEAFSVGWLRQELTDRSDSAHVGTRIPNPRPGRLVRLRVAGGQRTALVLAGPLVIADCWDPSETAASDLARLVEGLLLAADGETVGGVMCMGVEPVGSPVNLPDPDTSSPRYTVTVRMSFRATPA
jgi:hypothetical protein